MCEFPKNSFFFFFLISVQTYAAVLFAACGEYHLLSCRFQLTVEVFDYMDAELKLADTGEKQTLLPPF